MWDMIVSVPDHCLPFYFLHENDLQLIIRIASFFCFFFFFCFLHFVEV